MEGQFRSLEGKVEYLYRAVVDWILPQLRGAQQGIRGLYQQPIGEITTTGLGVFYCAPGSAIGGASGVPGVGAPGGPVAANVYAINAGAYTLVATGADVYNAMVSATTAGRVLAVAQNADGTTYTAIAQSCT
jgi:hypothetical protein